MFIKKAHEVGVPRSRRELIQTPSLLTKVGDGANGRWKWIGMLLAWLLGALGVVPDRAHADETLDPVTGIYFWD